MRKPTKSVKLSLSTETIAVLASDKLVAVAGGQKRPPPYTTTSYECFTVSC
jgi:hypothetical protein